MLGQNNKMGNNTDMKKIRQKKTNIYSTFYWAEGYLSTKCLPDLQTQVISLAEV